MNKIVLHHDTPSAIQAFSWYLEGKFDYLVGNPFCCPATRQVDREEWEKGFIEARNQFPHAKVVQSGGFAVPVPVVSDRELSAKQRYANPLPLVMDRKAMYNPATDYLRLDPSKAIRS